MSMQIPLAVVACLGKEVSLLREFVGPVGRYPAGTRAVMSSLEYEEGKGLRAHLALDPNDASYLEPFAIADIEPVGGLVSFSLDIEGGYLIS